MEVLGCKILYISKLIFIGKYPAIITSKKKNLFLLKMCSN